jgi:hypothetical protein
VTRRWHRSARGSRRTRAANTARSANPGVVVGWCGAGRRPRGAARGARRPWLTWLRTCGPAVGPARAPAGRSNTATTATRRDHVRPTITAGQRPSPDFWHPTGGGRSPLRPSVRVVHHSPSVPVERRQRSAAHEGFGERSRGGRDHAPLPLGALEQPEGRPTLASSGHMLTSHRPERHRTAVSGSGPRKRGGRRPERRL